MTTLARAHELQRLVEIGHVNDDEVRSPWTGELMGFLAVGGERVAGRQPIAWLRIP